MGKEKKDTNLKPEIWKYLYASKLGVNVEDLDFDEINKRVQLHQNHNIAESSSTNIKEEENLNSKQNNLPKNNLLKKDLKNFGETKKTKKTVSNSNDKTLELNDIKSLTEKKKYPDVYNYYNDLFNSEEIEQPIQYTNHIIEDTISKTEEQEKLESQNILVDNNSEMITFDEELESEKNYNEPSPELINDVNNTFDFSNVSDLSDIENSNLTNEEKVNVYTNLIENIDHVIDPNTFKDTFFMKLLIIITSIPTLGAVAMIHKSSKDKKIKLEKVKLLTQIQDLKKNLT